MKPGGGSAEFVPDRGDVLWLQLGPTAGHEQSGRRPAIVLSPASYNAKTGLALMCPITSKAKGYPFEVAMPNEGEVHGVILADQVRSVDWRSRRSSFATTVPAGVSLAVAAKLRALLP